MSRPLRRLGWPVTHTVGGPRQVCLIRCDALVQRVRPAEPLKPGRGLGVAQIGIVAAVAADDLERAGVAAFGSARNDANRLAAEERSAGLPVGISKSERHPCQFRHSPQNRFHVRQIRPYHISARRFQLILKGDPRRYRHTARTVTRTTAGDVVHIRAAHATHLLVVLTTAGVRSSAPVGLLQLSHRHSCPATLTAGHSPNGYLRVAARSLVGGSVWAGLNLPG